MLQRYKEGLFITATFFCLASSAKSNGQDLPNSKGKAEFLRTCSNCHSVTMATRLRHTQDGWKSVVDDMVSRGAQASQTELENIVSYLSTNFGPDKRLTSIPVQASVTPVTAPVEAPVVLSSATTSNAKRVLFQHGCTSCHRVGGEGSYVGPFLDDVGTRRKPEEIQAAIVAPEAKVHPENRQVRLARNSGTVVTGRLLNQDAYSVLLTDDRGRLMTISKAELKEFTILDSNPMPSFAGKIRDQDLADVVLYLSSLTEPSSK